MPTITIEVPDELLERLNQEKDRLPELLAQSLEQTVLPAHVYRHILDFLAGNRAPEEIAVFAPTPAMIERLHTLLKREAEGKLSPVEKAELDEYERIEHLVIMIKAGALTPEGRATVRLLRLNSAQRLAERQRLAGRSS